MAIKDLNNLINGKQNTSTKPQTTASFTSASGRVAPKAVTYYDAIQGKNVTAVFDTKTNQYISTTPEPTKAVSVKDFRGVTEPPAKRGSLPIYSPNASKEELALATRLTNQQTSKLAAQRAQTASILKDPNKALNTVYDRYNTAVDALNAGRMTARDAEQEFGATSKEARNLAAQMRMAQIEAPLAQSSLRRMGNTANDIHNEAKVEADRITSSVNGRYGTATTLEGKEREEYLSQSQKHDDAVYEAEVKRLSGVYGMLSTLPEDEAVSYLLDVAPEVGEWREYLNKVVEEQRALYDANRKAGSQQMLNTLTDPEERLEYLKQTDLEAAIHYAGTLYQLNKIKIDSIQRTETHGMQGNLVYSDAAQKAVIELQREQQKLVAVMQMETTVVALSRPADQWKRMAEVAKVEMDSYSPRPVSNTQVEYPPEYYDAKEQYDKYREYYFIAHSAQVWSTMSEPLQALALEAAKLDPTAVHYADASGVDRSAMLASERAAASAADKRRIDEIKGILAQQGYDADQVLTYAAQYYNAAATNAEMKKTEEFAQKNWLTKVLSTAASYSTQLMSGIGGISTVAHVAENKDKSVEEFVPADINNPLYAMSNYTTTIRGTVGADMSATGAYLYNAFNSAIDSTVRLLVAKNIAAGMTGAAVNSASYQKVVSNLVSAQMGSQVFVNTFLESKRAGMTDSEALSESFAAAAIEYITEKFSVESILKDPNALTAKALSYSYFAEASEEGASKILNTIRNSAKYRENSELNKEFEGYLAAGLSRKDAIHLVIGNYAKELALESMAGGLSGFGMAAASSAGHYATVKGAHTIDAYKVATPAIIDAVLKENSNDKQATAIAEQIAKEGIDSVKPSAIYKLVAQNPEIADEAVRQVEFATMVEEASTEVEATQQPLAPTAETVAEPKHTAIVQEALDRFNAGNITNSVYERVYDAAMGKDGKAIQSDLGINLSASGGLTTASDRKHAVKQAIKDIATREATEATEAKAVAETVAETVAEGVATEAVAQPTVVAEEKKTEFEPTIKLAIEAQKKGDQAKVASFAQAATKSPKIMAQLGLTTTGKAAKDKQAIIAKIADLAKASNPQPATAPVASAQKGAKLESYDAFAQTYKAEHPDATEMQIRAAYEHKAAAKVRAGRYIEKADGKKADYSEFRAHMISVARENGQAVSEEQIGNLFDSLYADQKALAQRVRRLQKTVDKLNQVFKGFGSQFTIRLSTSDIDFPKEMSNEAAFINYKSKEIVVNARVVSEESVLIKKVGHEIFHPGAKVDKQLVQDFLAFCRELNSKGKLDGQAKRWMDSEKATIERKVKIYQAHENKLVALGRKAKADTITAENAETELACDMFGELFDKTTFAADIVDYNPGFAVNASKTLQKILKAFGKEDFETKALKEHQEFIDKLAGFETKIEEALVAKADKESAKEKDNDVLDTAFKDYAIESIAAAAGIKAIEDKKTGNVLFITTEGAPVEEVLAEDIKTASGLGALIDTALENGFISEDEADKQYEAVARIMNMIIKTKDPQMVWKFAGASMFSALKANADGQYRTTIDFSTICRKTQEMIDAMSDAMMQLGRGLTKEEVIELQNTLNGVGANVPCPVCYVFSRWAGVGELLDRMSKWQKKYENYSDEQLNARIKALENVYAKTSTIKAYLAENDIEYQRLASERYDLAGQVKELNAKVRRKTEPDKEGKLKQIAQKKAMIESIDEQLKELVKAEGGEYAWLTKVRAKAVTDKDTGKVRYVARDTYHAVPPDVLFNLSDAEQFASDPRFKDSWKYRTTRGPSMGKAILPYSDMRIGDLILGVGKNSADGNKTFDPSTFVSAKGEKKTQAKLNDAQKKAYDLARKRTIAQNLIGGQRFQSTSDFRYDYALDYILTFFEAQALGSSMQTYTKILEFAEMAAAIGGDVNISVMPKDAGYKDGKLIFSSVTGVNYEGAVIVSNRYDNAQLILVGINDEHIRLALEDSAETGGINIGFVIPYHASGASIENFIKKLVENLNESFVSENYVDYSDVQNDKAKGAGHVTEEQSRRELLRLKILTGNETEEYTTVDKDGKEVSKKRTIPWRREESDFELLIGKSKDITGKSFAELRAVEKRALAGDKDAIREYESWSAGVLHDLYNKLWKDENVYNGARLDKQQAEKIMPHEFWDTNTTRENAYVNGFIFRSYCYSMGLNPRFTGKNSRGKSVGHGDFSDSTGYWKLLIDRPMYANDGTYRDQKTVNVSKLVANENSLKPSGIAQDLIKFKVNEPRKDFAQKAADKFVAATRAKEQGDVDFAIEEINGRLMPVVDTKNDTRDYKVAEAYLAGLINTEKPFSQILYDAQPVYIGADLPGEYKGSKYTERMGKTLRKAKMQAATNLDEMLLLAYDGEWRENQEEKHSVDAKEGWYYYQTEFAVPMYDPKTRNISHYNIYGGMLVIRNDADGKSYLYDMVDVYEKEKADAPPSSTDKTVRGKFGAKPSLDTDNTTDSEKVNDFSIEDDTDSIGAMLTPGQKEYFKDSKVRDSIGRLIRLFHGTQAFGFTALDLNQSDDGISFFMTDSPTMARSYSGTDDIRSVVEGVTNPDAIDPMTADMDTVADEYRRLAGRELRALKTESEINDWIDSQLAWAQTEIKHTRKMLETLVGSIQQLPDNGSQNTKDALEALPVFEELALAYDMAYSAASPNASSEEMDLTADALDEAWKSWNNLSRNNTMVNLFGSALRPRSVAEALRLSFDAKVAAEKGLGIFAEGYDYIWDEEWIRQDLANAYTYYGYGDAGNYALYANLTDPLLIDANGQYWNSIKVPGEYLEEMSKIKGREAKFAKTRDFARLAKALNKDGVIFRQLVDYGAADYIEDDIPATVVIAFNSNSVKDVHNENPTENDDFRYSLDEDSEGRKLSEGQQNYFADSQVRDAIGYLLVVYHGGTVGYEFDTNRQGRKGSQLGAGAYFTDDQTAAKDHALYAGGDAKAYYLNIRDMFDEMNMEKTRLSPSWEKLMQILKDNDIPALVINRLNEMDSHGFNYLRGYLARKSGVRTDGWDGSEQANALVREAGFDGISSDYTLGHKQYVIFNPEQAKLTTNPNPTADPDIRYSLDEDISADNRSRWLSALTIDDLLKMPDEEFFAMYGDAELELDLEDLAGEIGEEPAAVRAVVARKGLGDTYVAEGNMAVMTSDRIDRRINDSGASRPDYANSYITRISPKDFLDLTVTESTLDRDVFDTRVEGDHGSTMKTWDFAEQIYKSDAPPKLNIDRSTGQVIGHNGRHRVRALEMAGIESVEIEVQFYDDGSLIKYGATPVDDMAISSQFDTNIETHISNIIPLNKAFRNEIDAIYGEKAHPNAGVSYSIDDDEAVDEISEKSTAAFDKATAEAEANPVTAEDIGSIAQDDSPIGIAIYHQYLSQNTLDMISSNEVYQILLEQYGIIERRVPDYREAKVPRQSKPNNKVSKTVPTVMGAKATPESRLPDIKSAVAHHRVSYLPTTNKKDIQYARNIIYRDGFDVAKADWTAKVRSGQTSPRLVALGATILNNMGNTKEVTGVEYVNALVDYADLVRRAASSLQAAKILKNLTPEGKLYGIQREINKLNEDIKERNKKNGKKRRPSGPPVEWWATKTGEMLASQLMRSLPSSTDSARVKTVCQQIANDIATVARESLPKDTNKKAVSQAERDQKVLDRIQNIFNNQAEYQKIWGRAKNKLVDKFGALPDSLLAFDAWMEDLPAYTAKLLSDAMFDGVELNPALAEAFLAAETDADRDVVLEMIYADVASQVKATGMEKFNAVRYLFMLGNFRTQGRNILGNLAFQVPRLASVAVQGSVEAMVGKVAKWRGKSFDRTTSVLTDKATYKFALKDFENVRDAIMGGGKYEDAKGDSTFRDNIDKYRQILGFKAFSDESVANSTGAGKVAKKVVNAVTMSPEYYRKATNWAMDKGDEFFCSFTYADSLARFMRANGTTWEKASEELRDKARTKAIQDAAEATYRDNNQFAEMVSKIGKPRNPDNKAEKFVSTMSQGILSFRKTPANILVRAYEYSPVGAGVTALGLLRDTVKVIAKKDVEIDGTAIIKKMSQGLTGTGLVVLGAWLSSMGYLVGKAPEDEKEKQLWEMQGHQQYAIEFDSKSYTLDWLAPECIPLFLGANLQQAALSDGVSLGEFVKALGTLTDPILSMSMLQGVNDALENASSYGDDSALVRFAGNALWSYLTQALAPTFLGQIERGLEGQRMATYIEADAELKGVQKMVAKLSAKIPGWDYAQIVYTDAWGRTQDNSDSATLNLLYQMFSPGYVSTIHTTAMEEELLRLYKATGESKVLISTAGKTITVEGEEIPLSGDEYYSYNIMRGQTDYDIMTALTSSPGYANMDENTRVGAVERVHDYATQMAKYEITGGAYVPDKWVLNAYNASVETGLPISTIVSYRCMMSAEDEVNTRTVANANVRAAILADPTMTKEQKDILDDILINDNTTIPQDKKVDYTNYETFVITQMSDGAQKRWKAIKNQFHISADAYQEAWSIYHNDNLKADEKKRELAKVVGSTQMGNLLYSVLGKKLEDK